MTAKPQYRSLQQIAAQSLHRDINQVIESLIRFGAMTNPDAHKDSVEKMRKVGRRIADHMHKNDLHE